MSRIAYLALAAWLMTACGPPAPPAAPGQPGALDPGPLRPPDTLPYSFQWRQRVTAKWPTGTQAFDAVLQKRDGKLLMMGLSPMGVPGFVITLHPDGGIDFQNRTGREPPFQPHYILADVQRVFFPWLPEGEEQSEGPDRKADVLGMHIEEKHQRGRLVKRTFTRDDAPDAGKVVVRYEGYKKGADAPERVVLKSDWFGYTLIIETLEQTRLDG